MSAVIDEQLAQRILAAMESRTSTLIVGVCGAQGSGKSTLTASLQQLLQSRGVATAVISIDDLYLTKAERSDLGQRVHPLLRTRGVPGTHDVALGRTTLDALAKPGVVAIPSFDKACDDRRPIDQWPRATAPVRVVILEGWFVGAIPQSAQSLAAPVNALEKNNDSDGRWRRYVNDALAGEYQRLFSRIDLLILLKAPSFDVVYGWRLEQEEKLRAAAAKTSGETSGIMSATEVRRFIEHYERISRHILEEMAGRADVVVELDAARVGRVTKG